MTSGLTQVLGEFTPDDDTYYLLGLDVIGQQNTTNGWNYFGYDGLGTVRGMFNSNANLVQSSYFDPYGNPIIDTGFTIRRLDSQVSNKTQVDWFTSEPECTTPSRVHSCRKTQFGDKSVGVRFAGIPIPMQVQILSTTLTLIGAYSHSMVSWIVIVIIIQKRNLPEFAIIVIIEEITQ